MPAILTRVLLAGVTATTSWSCGSTPQDQEHQDPAPDAPPGEVDAASDAPPGPLAFVAVTFNTGITEGAHHDLPPDDGFSSDDAKTNADHYGNGLAWRTAIADTKAFFETVNPDVVAFQEIFHPEECAGIAPNDRIGFVCETWAPGDPLVTQMVLGMGYQVACNLGHPDKCAAVKKSFGTFRGCAADVCLDGLDGAQVPTCGQGSRIGRGVIDLVGGGSIAVINVHGSSGFSSDENACRKKQFKLIFSNLDGQPAAVAGARNLILGDFNTDPGRLDAVDESADYLNDHVNSNEDFHFITEVGSSAEPTYKTFNIDHVISDAFGGSCWAAGISSGHPAVTEMTYFDHTAIVCNVTE